MELLSPAGNLEKLKTAVLFGADAVYCGAGSYSLRSEEASFTLEQLKAGVEFAHQHDCRVYLAMNIIPFDEDLDEMASYLGQAVEAGIDAVIASDPGMISLARRRHPGLKIHLSTQANTTNSESAQFWQNQGVNRIVLARELSLAQIGRIKKTNPDLELEVFIHGAMCVAYSGRCLLSKVLNDRSANRGSCTQPCRWEYRIREISRDEELTINEDGRGTFILNSRDLCMIEHIPQLAEAGVDSLKIEGRMKTAYYVAAVTRIYRAALDSYARAIEEGKPYEYDHLWREELEKVSHRPYTTGFYFPDAKDETEYISDAAYVRGYDFVGKVDECSPDGLKLKVKVRNRFNLGDTLEILDPGSAHISKFKVGAISDCETGDALEAAHNSYLVHIMEAGSKSVSVGQDSIIRRKLL